MSIQVVFETLENVTNTSGRNAKLALINALVSVPENKYDLRDVINYCYNPFYLYRVSVPTLNPPAVFPLSDTEVQQAWRDFILLLDELWTRKIELSVGRAQLKVLIDNQPVLIRKYFCQIINRDIKCGVQSWSKWFPGLLPAEPLMLCEKWEGQPLTGDWIAEPKIDGFRAAVVVDDNGDCEVISRGNKTFWNYEHIAEEIKGLGVRNVVFDGEFYAGNFGLTGSICKTQSVHPERLKLKYYIFDMLTMEEWKAVKCVRNTAKRKDLLASTLYPAQYMGSQTRNFTYLVPLFGVIVQQLDQIQDFADEFYKQGFEGTVLKKFNASYIFDRSSAWLKIKPENDADVTVIGAELGAHRHSNRLGAFFVKGTVKYKGKEFEITSKVGGGFSDTERDAFWKQYQEGKLVGLVVEITYQDVSVEAGTSNYSLRFPRFKRIRWDKSPMELQCT